MGVPNRFQSVPESINSMIEKWPLREPFSISRFTFHYSLIQTITLRSPSGLSGQGECEPHDHDERVAAELSSAIGVMAGEPCRPAWLNGLTRANLLNRLPRSPLRNAIDCALWDLEAKSGGTRAHTLAGMPLNPVPVLPTLGIDTPEKMAGRASLYRNSAWLKVKLGNGDGLDPERLEAISSAAPGVSILADANGGWTPGELARMLPIARRSNVRMIEQPMRPEFDAELPQAPADILLCADESCLDRSSLELVRKRYQYINIKLDKAGGLTEALALRGEAESAGLGVMVGMMSGSSLAVAPASVLAQGLEIVDLEVDFMIKDRVPALEIENFTLSVPEVALWG